MIFGYYTAPAGEICAFDHVDAFDYALVDYVLTLVAYAIAYPDVLDYALDRDNGDYTWIYIGIYVLDFDGCGCVDSFAFACPFKIYLIFMDDNTLK